MGINEILQKNNPMQKKIDRENRSDFAKLVDRNTELVDENKWLKDDNNILKSTNQKLEIERLKEELEKLNAELRRYKSIVYLCEKVKDSDKE